DFTVSLRDVELGMLFIEQAGGAVKVSIRARGGIDCSQLAARFGGGGHREAAGATLTGPMSETVVRVLKAVEETFGQNTNRPTTGTADRGSILVTSVRNSKEARV